MVSPCWFLWAGLACGQTLPTAARIESVPLELTMPERYQVDGGPRADPAGHAGRTGRWVHPQHGSPAGRDGARVAGDRAARPDRGRRPAEDGHGRGQGEAGASPRARQAHPESSEAQLEAAQARVELAQLALDRCTLRAPFAGRVDGPPGLLRAICAQGNNDRRAGRCHQLEDALARGSPERRGRARP